MRTLGRCVHLSLSVDVCAGLSTPLEVQRCGNQKCTRTCEEGWRDPRLSICTLWMCTSQKGMGVHLHN